MTTQSQMEAFIRERSASLNEEQTKQGEFFYKHFVENKPMNTIPEEVFVKYILPFFNPNNPMNEETYATFLTNWIALAGAPTLELAVADTNGNIVFLCPAMFDTEIINAKRELATDKTVSSFFKAYLAHQDVTAFAANVFFNNNAYEIYKNLVKGHPRLEENRKKWEEIFTRYGLMTPSGTPIINGNNRNQETDDVFD